MTYRLRNFVEAISESETAPQNSPFDRFVGLEHYDSGELEITRFSDTSLLSSSVKVFHKNDILIARRNVYLRRAGIVFFDGLTSGDSIILRVLSDCESSTGVPYNIALRWLPLILNSSVFWAYANKHADGMNSKRISKEMLLDYEFYAPTLDEIISVTEKVWAAHELKNRYRVLLKATDEIVKSRFIEMFGQVSDMAPRHDVKKLSDCCSYISDGSHFSPAEDSAGPYPMLSVKDMTENGFVYSDCKYISKKDFDVLVSNGCQPHLNDVLVAKDGSYFKYSFVVTDNKEQAILSSIAILRPKTDIIDPKYLSYYMLTDAVIQLVEKNYLTGTAIRRVILKGFKEIPTIVPPMELQKSFVAVLGQADKSKFELKQAIEKIDKVMKSLLQ